MRLNVTEHSNQVGLHRIDGGGCEESEKTSPSFDCANLSLLNSLNQTRVNLVYIEFTVS